MDGWAGGCLDDGWMDCGDNRQSHCNKLPKRRRTAKIMKIMRQPTDRPTNERTAQATRNTQHATHTATPTAPTDTTPPRRREGALIPSIFFQIPCVARRPTTVVTNHLLVVVCSATTRKQSPAGHGSNLAGGNTARTHAHISSEHRGREGEGGESRDHQFAPSCWQL